MRDLAPKRCIACDVPGHAGAAGWVATAAMGAAMLFAPDSLCRSGEAAFPALAVHAGVMLAAMPLSPSPSMRRATRRIGPERCATLAWTLALAALCLAAIAMAPSGPRLPGETLGLQAALLAAWLGAIVLSCGSPATRAHARTRGTLPALGAPHAPCFAALVVAVGAVLR